MHANCPRLWFEVTFDFVRVINLQHYIYVTQNIEVVERNAGGVSYYNLCEVFFTAAPPSASVQAELHNTVT